MKSFSIKNTHKIENELNHKTVAGLMLAFFMMILLSGCTQVRDTVMEDVTSSDVAAETTSNTHAAIETTMDNHPTLESSLGNNMETETSLVSSELFFSATEKSQVAPAMDRDYEEQVDHFDEESDPLSSTQRNSINMLNYMTVLTQEINESKGSRLYLESAYSSLINNIYPNAVDTRTQAQIRSILNTLEEYRMIAVKRERLEYLYEQSRAQALRQAIPNPVGLLSAVESGNLLKTAASVIYMAVDSASSYAAASSQADLQYLKEGWELDDKESAELHNSRMATFEYMINMVRDNALPGDYALTAEHVQNFVEWKNNTNLVRKIAWLETNQETYQQFGPYWLELVKSYYDSKEYVKCLDAINQYELTASRIFRKDFNYAETLPMAIISAKESFGRDTYIETADRYTAAILENTNDDDWALRYFAAQIYLDLYAATKDAAYMDEAYKIAFNNVNVLVDEQRNLNAVYLADIQPVKADKDATKREKAEVKQYNQLLKEERKTALPPVSEALYLNCDLLFSLADERNISSEEQVRIESVLHENGENIFLTDALDNMFWFDGRNGIIDLDEIMVEFDGNELSIPAACITERSTVRVTVSGINGRTILEDWAVVKVKRPKNAGCPEFVVTFTSQKGKDFKYQAGDTITITVVPIAESPEEVIEFTYDTVTSKKRILNSGIAFERR